ncbi:MAG: PmoA family protein [Pyrinomonadaceae bacterium]
MFDLRRLFLGLALCATWFSPTVVAQTKRVEFVRHDNAHRVDVLVDGKPFTSYLWPAELKKPVLFPVRTANGAIVTRGYPFEPRAGESIDHPHQIGLWFNYGDVNGVDFWNNSLHRPKEEAAKMGTIYHRRIVKAVPGKTRGELVVEMDWALPDGKIVLREVTKFIFAGSKNSRVIDRITTLTSLDQRVVFNDNKEGLIGFRVARDLEQTAKEPILLTDGNGKPSEQAVLDNTGVTGEFRSSEGLTGDEVWGTRGRWAMLTGKIGQETVTLAILDHPQNPGYPTYWFTRGYGLFAANPLGQKAFSTEKKESPIRELKFTLEPKRSVTFRFRVLIFSMKPGKADMDAEAKRFSKTNQ